ncbi:hypothetical protein [Alcanivorax sp.]|uniref:hypothetical protein n=1 Tax=Alcanivorax sp. TaxID=1872427 RepID=UPI003BAAB37B
MEKLRRIAARPRKKAIVSEMPDIYTISKTDNSQQLSATLREMKNDKGVTDLSWPTALSQACVKAPLIA